MNNLKLTLAAGLAMLVVAGCGAQNQVGSQGLLNFTPAPSPRAVPSPSPSPTQAAVNTRPSPIAQHSTAPPAQTVVVTIQSDTAPPPALNPQDISVAVGTIVKWVNKDSQPRGVAGGPFRSPLIAPGDSWSYTFTSPGTFDYQDEQRPYVTGQVTVH